MPSYASQTGRIMDAGPLGQGRRSYSSFLGTSTVFGGASNIIKHRRHNVWNAMTVGVPDA